MDKLVTLLLVSCVAIGMATSTALAQQGQPQSPTDHSAHHDGTQQGAGQQAPGGGMMSKGGTGQGMMGGGMMGQDGKAGGPDMMDCPMMGKGMMGGGMGKGMMHSRPMMEARLAYIKADLEITDAQMAAWETYVGAVRARHTAMESAREAMMKSMKSGNAMERMDARIQATEVKLESLKALQPATEALYGVMTDDQKMKADKLLGGGCGMM